MDMKQSSHSKRIALIVSILLVLVSICAGQSRWWEKNGELINDSQYAIDIATIYLKRAFGEKRVQSALPLEAKKYQKEWVVQGTLPPQWKGGVPGIRILAKNGQVVEIWHSK
jgi:NTF2 fold immunity protein